MTSELMSCPFCGSPALLEQENDHHGEWFNLGCSRHWEKVKKPDNPCPTGRLFYTEDMSELDAAIKFWNTRAPTQITG